MRGSGNNQVGYPFLRGTNSLTPGIDIAGNTPGPNHRYRITVDHRSTVVTGAQILVERNAGSGFTTIIHQFDIFSVNGSQQPVPENFRFSLTGSTGGNTNIHEIDNLRICATRIENIVQIDHFRFIHDGQGLTCSSEQVTVLACLNSDCSQQFTDPISVTLSPTDWLGGDTQTIISGQTLELRSRTPGNVTLGVINSSVPRRPFTADRCFVGGCYKAIAH